MEMLEARKVDDRRRLVLPPDIPPGATVTLQRAAPDIWILRVRHAESQFKIVLLPDVDRLPDDPEWECKELQSATGLMAQIPPPEE